MPKMDGKTLLNRIRDDQELAEIPVLMITCEDSSTAIKEIISAKVSGFIVKPFNLNVLDSQLKKVMKLES